jgi:hypothetical protein
MSYSWGNSQPIVLVGWQKIRAWISELMQMNVIVIDSQAHEFRWLWNNLTPLEVI